MRSYKFGIAVGMVLAILLNLAGPKIYAQLQQSGGPGSIVTIGAALPAGTNVIGHTINDTGSTTAVTGNVAVTSAGLTNLDVLLSTRLKPADTLAAVTTVGAVTAITNALPTGTNTIGVVIPKTPCGTTVFSQPLLAVPTSTGSPTSTTTCVMRAYFNNSNASAQTVTLTDNSGTPLNVIGAAFSVPGLSNMVVPFDGIQFTSGVKWIAGGAGVVGGFWGFQ